MTMGWKGKKNRARQRIMDQTRKENTFLWDTFKETDLSFPTDITLKKKKKSIETFHWNVNEIKHMLLSISTFSSLPPPLSSSFFLTKTTVQCPAQKHISHHLSRADSDCSTNENLRFAAGKMLLPSTDEKSHPRKHTTPSTAPPVPTAATVGGKGLENNLNKRAGTTTVRNVPKKATGMGLPVRTGILFWYGDRD